MIDVPVPGAPGRRTAAALGLLLACFTALSLWSMAGDSATFDEGVHLSAGYTALTRRDFRMNPEHPPLGKILAALPLLFMDVRLPADPEPWKHGSQWTFGYRFLYQAGNDADLLLFLGRLSTLFWSLLLITAVYAVSSDLFGWQGGLLSAACAAFCPLLLGHGHLVTTDVVVTALLLLSLLALRGLLGKPSLLRAAAAGILLGGAVGAKFSAAILLPAFVWISLARRFREGTSTSPDAAGAARRRVRAAACAVVLAAAFWATLWGLYGFRYGSSADGTLDYTVRAGADAGLTTRLLGWAARHAALPGGFLHGFALAQEHASTGHEAYALGAFSDTGWAWYFPFAFLVKTPLCALALFGWGAWVAARRKSGKPGDLDFLTIPLIVYSVLAVSSRLNIGLRHVLPVYPLLMILAGSLAPAVLEASGARRRRGVLTALLIGLFAEVVWAAPHHLSFFNVAARSVAPPHALLVDSNLDWGQDLKRLKHYVDRRGIRRLKLAYFGAASPRALGLEHEMLPGRNLYSWHSEGWRETSPPFQPGDVVAVSASVLAGLMMSDRRLYAEALRDLEPEARIGDSILVYRIGPPAR